MGQLGCLAFNSCHVLLLLGVIPLDCRMWQAFLHIPDLHKDHKVDITLKSGSNETDVVLAAGVTGMGQLGCLAFNSCHVLLLLGVIPLDCRMWQAFLPIPDLHSDTVWSITLVRWLMDVLFIIIYKIICREQRHKHIDTHKQLCVQFIPLVQMGVWA